MKEGTIWVDISTRNEVGECDAYILRGEEWLPHGKMYVSSEEMLEIASKDQKLELR